MKIVSPCQGCEKRQVGCHASCEAYKTFAKNLKAAKQAAYDENSLIYYYHHKGGVLKKIKGSKK